MNGKASRAITGSNQDAKLHVPALDGIRGLAILLVLICHLAEKFTFARPALMAVRNVAFAGWTGVDLFFVLSGFLITGILWDAREDNHYFKNFYARRTVRIFPLYYVTLLFLFIVSPAVLPLFQYFPGKLYAVAQEQIGWFSQTAANFWGWYVSYFVDVLIALKGFSGGLQGVVIPGHFWSLAVEEHFYFVWPFVVYYLSKRALIRTSWGILVGALLIRALLVPFLNPVAIYVLTPLRMDGLALGALIALTLRSHGGLQKLTATARRLLPASAILWVALAVVLRGWWQYGALAQTIGYTTTILFYGSMLILALPGNAFSSFFAAGSLRFLGKYSYALYVFHVFPFFFFAPFFALGDPLRYSVVNQVLSRMSVNIPDQLWVALDGCAYIIVAVGTSVLMALISWRVLEQPCLSLKRYFPMKDKVIREVSAEGKTSVPRAEGLVSPKISF